MRDGLYWTILVLGLFLSACSSARGPEPVTPTPPPPADPLSSQYLDELEKTAKMLDVALADTRSFELEMEIPSHDSVEAAVKYFAGARRDTIQRSFRRSAPWLPMIHEILSSYDLPADLAYLPVIESGYRPTLTSSAGAHGMWQFMGPTAREYGLRVDWWVDERADPWKATRAAAHYLSDLYRMFGDWPLALAAYNCGPGRVSRTLESEGVKTFWELLERRALPKETRGYVPTFYATIVLAGAPERFGFDLPPTEEIDYEEVEIRGPVALEFVADSIGIEGDEILLLNADLHRGIVPPGPWSIRVPRNSARSIAGRDWYLEDSTVEIASYSMRSTENLDRFAKRIGVDAKELRAINNLRGDRLDAGSTLWIPIRQTELAARLTGASKGDDWHVVSPGDTLFSIARRNGLSVEELVDLNRLGSDHTIHPGDRLIVRAPATATGGM